MGVMKLVDVLPPVATALLAPGEELIGCCVATWQKTFTGGMYAVAVAPTRIVLQKLDRRFAPTGDPLPLPPERIARAAVENGIGGEWSIPNLIMDAVSISVLITTTDGERLKLMVRSIANDNGRQQDPELYYDRER